MPSKRNAATSPSPSTPAVPASAVSSSARPSTAASSQSTTSSQLKNSPGTTKTSHSSKPSTGSASLSSSSAASLANPKNVQEIVQAVWTRYHVETPQRTKLIDAFMGFLVVVGVLQFVYCVLVGNYPFNAFLSGFSATVGQFVLTASLRMQTNPANKAEFRGDSAADDRDAFSPERAFADFVLGSLVLHFFCVNFIN